MSNSNQNSARQHQSNQNSDRKQLNIKKIVDEFSELDAFGGPNSKIDVRLNNSQKNQINQIIAKLEEIRHKESVYNETIIVDQLMTKEDVILLISKATFIFKQEDVLLEVKAPIKIFGDIHGQFIDLLRLFDLVKYPNDLGPGMKAQDHKYLFMGDYVDRGKQSIETICLLLAYKIKYPTRIFLLRGNHECSSINRIYGFYDECKRKYDLSIWKQFTICFNWLPVSAVVSDKILCMHGGLSPDLIDKEDIMQIQRPSDVPDKGMLCDLLWADPDNKILNWGENERGVSYTFGKYQITKFLEKNHIDLICRAHQVVIDGYEFFNNRDFVTIFSAPDYCGEFDNKASCMIVDGDLSCKFNFLQPLKRLSNEHPQMRQLFKDCDRFQDLFPFKDTQVNAFQEIYKNQTSEDFIKTKYILSKFKKDKTWELL